MTKPKKQKKANPQPSTEVSPTAPSETSGHTTVFLSADEVGKLEFWPEAAVFELPLPDSDEEHEFRRSLASGQHEPITLVSGKGLDGRRRVRAALHPDVHVGLHAVVRDDVQDRLGFVLDKQFRRRETSPSQRAMAVARREVRAHFQQQAKGRQGRRDLKPDAGGGRGQWEDDAGRVAKVSGTSVQSAVKVWDKGVPELHSLVVTGNVAVSAAETIVNNCDRGEQFALCARGHEAVTKMATFLRGKEKEKKKHEQALKQGKERARRQDHLNFGPTAPVAPLPDDPNADNNHAAGAKESTADANKSDASEIVDQSAPDESADSETCGESPHMAWKSESGIADAVLAVLPVHPDALAHPSSLIAFRGPLHDFFGRDPLVTTDDNPATLAGHDVVFAGADTATALCEHLFGGGAADGAEVLLVAPMNVGSPAAQRLLSTKPTCIVAGERSQHDNWLIAYFGMRTAEFADTIGSLGAVVVPAQQPPPQAALVVLAGPDAARIRALRDSDGGWVSSSDVARALGTAANAIDIGLAHRLLPNGRHRDLKVVPARALAQRLRERPTLVAKLKGKEREAWCAFLDDVGGVA